MRVLLLWLLVWNICKVDTAARSIKTTRPQPLLRLSNFDLAQVTIDPSLYPSAWSWFCEHLVDILLGLALALVCEGVDGDLLEVMLETVYWGLSWRKVGVIWLLCV